MYRHAQKPLSFVLIFLLWLAPLQIVMANVSAPVDQTTMPCELSVNLTDMVHIINQSDHDCEMCVKANDCHGNCTTGHCASNMVGLLQDLLPVTHFTSSLAIFQPDENTTKQQLPALFRPPRF